MIIKEEYIDYFQEFGEEANNNNFKVDIKDELIFESEFVQSFPNSLGPDQKGSEEIQIATHFITTILQNAEDSTLPNAMENRRKKRKTAQKGPFKCDCGAKFPAFSKLENHKVTHTDIKLYKCEIPGCTSKFSTVHSRIRHEKLHDNYKPFRCNLKKCNVKFARASDLEDHKRIHTGIRPYKCDVCSSTFTKSCNLSAHKKIHTGDKPHKCNFENCKYAFIKSSDLTRHKQRHLGGKAYKCDLKDCKAAFTRLANLKRHYKDKH